MEFGTEMRKQQKIKVQMAYIYVTLDIVILTLPPD